MDEHFFRCIANNLMKSDLKFVSTNEYSMILRKIKTLIVVLVVITFNIVMVQGQSYSSSRVYVQTNYHKEVCFSFSSDAFLYYDANKQELSFSIDFSTFKVGIDSLDEWLDDLSDGKLKFVASLPEDQLPPISNHSSRLFHLGGDLTMNGKTNKHIVDAVIFSITDQNTQHKSSGNPQ